MSLNLLEVHVFRGKEVAHMHVDHTSKKYCTNAQNSFLSKHRFCDHFGTYLIENYLNCGLCLTELYPFFLPKLFWLFFASFQKMLVKILIWNLFVVQCIFWSCVDSYFKPIFRWLWKFSELFTHYEIYWSLLWGRSGGGCSYSGVNTAENLRFWKKIDKRWARSWSFTRCSN